MHSRNRLLATLPPAAVETLNSSLEPLALPIKQVLVETDQPIDHVYFPTEGVVSVVNEPNPGEIVEVATIGNEGLVGLPVVLGVESMPNRAFVQVPGQALRITSAALIAFVERQPDFRALLMKYSMALLNQVAQNASCNRLHEVQERCARWLLQTHDRVAGDSFPLTHEFLGQMLGVHRPTVSIAAGILQRAGVIRYSRGIITVLDRVGLEEAACSCYRFIVSEYDRLLGHGPPG